MQKVTKYLVPGDFCFLKRKRVIRDDDERRDWLRVRSRCCFDFREFHFDLGLHQLLPEALEDFPSLFLLRQCVREGCYLDLFRESCG